MKNKSRNFVWPGLFILIIVISRLATISHGAGTHPDEDVFYTSAYRMSRVLFGSIDAFTPVKYYPEGGFVCQLPFQIVLSIIGKLFRFQPENWAIGRISGITYFTLGTILGYRILTDFFKEYRQAPIIFLMAMTFGLLHIEQSRYGTGEPPSFFFLMAVIWLVGSSAANDKHKLCKRVLAYLLCGVLAAIKYPQIYFVLIPVLTDVFTNSRESCKKIITGCFLRIAAVCAGFFLFSPCTLIDINYLVNTIRTETNAYLVSGNPEEIGGVWNHLLYFSVYELAYAGIPLFSLAGILWQLLASRKKTKMIDVEKVFYCIVPAIMLVFAVYNLFAKTFFLRTVYPFSTVSEIYAAVCCANMIRRQNCRRVIAAVCALMVLRGGCLLYVLRMDDIYARTNAMLSELITGNDYTLTVIDMYPFAYYGSGFFEQYEPVDLHSERFATETDCEVRPGELLISGIYDFDRYSHYLLPISDDTVKEGIRRWDMIQQVNSEYSLGRLYPDSLYYLFGYWVKGSTGTYFEFPSNVYFFRPQMRADWAAYAVSKKL